MLEMESLAALAHHFESEMVAELGGVKRGLEKAAKLIEETAQDEIGTYQGAIGPYPEWASLADSTEQEKTRLGYPANAPLLRTGDLRESIVHEVGEWEATVGSTDPVMTYHEFGTDKMPPRPVIGPALYRNLDAVQQLVGDFAYEIISGEKQEKRD